MHCSNGILVALVGNPDDNPATAMDGRRRDVGGPKAGASARTALSRPGTAVPCPPRASRPGFTSGLTPME